MTLLTSWCGFAKTEPASLKPIKFNCRHNLSEESKRSRGSLFAYKWQFEVLGLQIKAKSNTFLWTAGWCQLLFFFFFDWHFLSSFFFFPVFFIISLNGRSLEKQRIQMSEISWGRRALRCEINRLYALLNNLVRTPKKKGNAFNISSRNVKLIYKEWLLCSRRENVLIVNIFWQWTNL